MIWDSNGATYDVARAREQLGKALRAGGDEDAAVWELQAAAARFERLGAVRDADRVAELLMRDLSTDVMKTFLFTDIVGSTELASAVASDRHWVNLLRRHDDALRAIFADFQGQVVDHTGDGFFAAFEEPADAVGAAIAIQRAIDQEFEFDIRIGVHTDGALQTRENYHGKGVHAAARIGAAAGGREILASAATMRELPQFAASDHRAVTLKGFKEPIDVCSVSWQDGLAGSARTARRRRLGRIGKRVTITRRLARTRLARDARRATLSRPAQRRARVDPVHVPG